MKPSLTLIVALYALAVITFGGVYIANAEYHVLVLYYDYLSMVKSNEADFDNATKAIPDAAKVSKEQVAEFKKIYADHAAGGTGAEVDAAVGGWIQGNVTKADKAAINNLQHIISSNRDDWVARQKKIIDVSLEFNGRLGKFPENGILCLLGFKKIVLSGVGG